MLWVSEVEWYCGNTIPASENVATGVPRSRVFRGSAVFSHLRLSSGPGTESWLETWTETPILSKLPVS